MLVTGLLGGGCAEKVTTGPFRQVDQLERVLHRGVSTKMDVRQVLGAPTGTGGALMPFDPTPDDVWYYEDLELTDIESLKRGTFQMTMRQQILLVFFEDDRFDGFMWFTNAGTGFGRLQPRPLY